MCKITKNFWFSQRIFAPSVENVYLFSYLATFFITKSVSFVKKFVTKNVGSD